MSSPTAVIRCSCFGLVVLGLCCSGPGSGTKGPEWEPKSFSEYGHPYFQFQAYPRSGEHAGVEISLALSTESVVFIRSGEWFEASVELICRVREPDAERPVLENGWADTIRTAEYSQTRTRQTRYMNRFLALAPGDYVVEMTLTDQNSEKSASRVRRITVSEPKGDWPVGGEIQILCRKRTGQEVPLLGPYLENQAGTLNCFLEVNNLRTGDSVVSTVVVLRVERDSTSPLLPYEFNAVQGSLQHAGISFESTQRVFLDTITLSYPNAHEIRWQLSLAEEGIYLAKVEGQVYRANDVITSIIESTRPLVVMPAGFPRPTQTEQLVASVEYIMLESERDSLEKAETIEDRRRWLEHFWRSIGRNEEGASHLIERYYSRVEEANDYFSSLKEGWKTDRGMIYIVLGPPLSVETGLQGELWNYSPVEGDRLNSYYFRKVQLREEFQNFEHFLLDRQPYYDQQWFAAVDRWRRGSGF